MEGQHLYLHEGRRYRSITKPLQGDAAFVAAAITSSSVHALAYAAPLLRADRDFMLQAAAVGGGHPKPRNPHHLDGI